MLERALFDKIMAHVNAVSPGDVDRYYARYRACYTEFIDDTNPLILPPDTGSERVELSLLYAAQWGTLALGNTLETTPGALGIAYQGFFTAMANYALSITHATLSGMDLQANVLMRGLYELVTLFLAVTIDENLQSAFLKDNDFEQMDAKWYKHLRHKRLEKIVQAWAQKQAVQLTDLLGEEQDITYKRLSAMVHNQLLPIAVLSFTRADKDDDPIIPNVWGRLATRTDSTLWLLHSLLSYANLCLIHLLKEGNPTLISKLQIGEFVAKGHIGRHFSLFMDLANWLYSYHYLRPAMLEHMGKVPEH